MTLNEDVLNDQLNKDDLVRKKLFPDRAGDKEDLAKYLVAKDKYLPRGELESEDWVVTDKSTPEVMEKIRSLEDRESKLIEARDSFIKKNDLESARGFSTPIDAVRRDITLTREHVAVRSLSGRDGNILSQAKLNERPFADLSMSAGESLVSTTSIDSSSAKFKSLQEAISTSGKTAEELLIPVKLVKHEFQSGGVVREHIEAGSGEVHNARTDRVYKNKKAISIQTMSGKHLDYVPLKFERIMKGAMPEGQLFARVHSGPSLDESYLRVGHVSGGSFSPIPGFTRSVREGMTPETEGALIDFFGDAGKTPKEVPIVSASPSVKSSRPIVTTDDIPSAIKDSPTPAVQPKTFKKPRAGVTKVRVDSILSGEPVSSARLDVVPGGDGPFSGKGGKKLMMGLSIAAGALLLWGASKQKRSAPLSEDDVRSSPYGANSMDRSSGGNGYTPRAKITQNGGGYATNINMDATDNSGNTDYRSMANTMGSIASSHSGGVRATTSLHVVDDSFRMDSESVKRSINQQLSI